MSAEDHAACAAVLEAKSYYDVLQIPDGCRDTGMIRKSYLKVSIRVHPDRNKDPQATAAFQRVSEAYAVLSDATKRREYDAQKRSVPVMETTPMAEFSFVDALRVFRAAVTAAELAGFGGDTPLANTVRIASALLALRDVGAGSALTDAAAVAAGVLGTATAAVALLPESWQTKIQKACTPENALKAVGTAVLVAGVIGSALESQRSGQHQRRG